MHGRQSKLRIIFVNYGPFRSNSGGHVINFANHLSRLGHTVAVCATGEASDPECGLDPGVHAFTHTDVDEKPIDVRNCGGGELKTIIHLWTPREIVLRLAKRLNADGSVPLFIHLEDNEDVIAATNLGLDTSSIATVDPRRLPNPYPETLSHPYRYRESLRQANGVTTIVDKLGEFVPVGVPTMILEPGVDHELYQDKLTIEKKREIRGSLGLDESSRIFVYHGNMHATNQREIFSLYTAAIILRRRKRNVHLIRTGVDYTDGLDLSYSKHLKPTATQLGFVGTERLVEILSLSEFYVQPGTNNQFNDYRFPSKIPEFFSMGKPTILPNTNIAKRLRNGEDAILLARGDGTEIADCVERILDDQGLAAKLGQNARAFAIGSLNWKRNAERLLEFYNSNTLPSLALN